MFCSNCGKDLPEGANACPACGTVIEAAAAEAATQPTQPQQTYAQPQPTYAQPAASEKSKVAAGLFGIFFGSLGIHKFYLGYTTSGLIMVLVSIIAGIFTFGIAAGVMGIIGLIEGILYLTKSDEAFKQTYVDNKKEWF